MQDDFIRLLLAAIRSPKPAFDRNVLTDELLYCNYIAKPYGSPDAQQFDRREGQNKKEVKKPYYLTYILMALASLAEWTGLKLGGAETCRRSFQRRSNALIIY